jgi:hypothetical protein
MPTHLASRWLFLRLLGVVYLFAFLSLAFQIVGLVGQHGLLPVGEYLDQVRAAYGPRIWRLLPTVLWLDSSDSALRLLSWFGVGLSALLVLDVAPIVVLPLLWIAYLSLSVAGQDFLAFQWDALLLETGLLACLWAPAGWLPTLRLDQREPSAIVRWLLWLLLAKLMFLSGITKLLSSDPTWRNLTALDFYFETQPLPPWPAWYAHHVSQGMHRLMAAAMFVVELGAPFSIFMPARLRAVRIAGAFLLIAFQLAIAATGNYGFFNLLAIVLCVPLLDDRLLGRILPRPKERPRPESRFRRVFVGAVAAVLLVLSGVTTVREIAYTLPAGAGLRYLPGWAEDLLDAFAPFRSVNGYGLFRVMTTERPEIQVEGSRDGTEWKAYEFRWKPGDPVRRPAFVEPFHPRLDWQMWFAALDPQAYRPLLESLIEHLLEGTPEVLGLLGRNPFQGSAPKYLRLRYFRYSFSSPEERARSGVWWSRESRGNLTQPVSLPSR